MPKSPQDVHIPRPNVQHVEVTVTGDALIMNNFSEEDADTIEGGQTGRAGAKGRQKPPRDPQAEFERARLRNPKGQDCIKTIAFKKAMVATGSVLGIAMTQAKKTLFVEGDLLPIKFKGNEPTMRRDRVRLSGQGRKTSLAYRPQYNNWEVTFTISFNADVWSLEQVLHLLAHTGYSVGVGAWRVDCDGQFGRFRMKGNAKVRKAA